MRHRSENVCRWTASCLWEESAMEDFHARKNSIDGCTALKGRMSDGDWTSKGYWMVSGGKYKWRRPRKSGPRVRIMKEIPNGVENTGNPPSVLSTFLTPFLASGYVVAPVRRRSHCKTGLGSFAAAVGSTRWVAVTPSSSLRMEQWKAWQLVAFTSNLRKMPRKSRELASPKCGCHSEE